MEQNNPADALRVGLGMKRTEQIAESIRVGLEGESVNLCRRRPGTYDEVEMSLADQHRTLMRVAHNIEQVLMPDEDVLIERVCRVLQDNVHGINGDISMYDLCVQVIQTVLEGP